jgi:hypothetical protein
MMIVATKTILLLTLAAVAYRRQFSADITEIVLQQPLTFVKQNKYGWIANIVRNPKIFFPSSFDK